MRAVPAKYPTLLSHCLKVPFRVNRSNHDLTMRDQKAPQKMVNFWEGSFSFECEISSCRVSSGTLQAASKRKICDFLDVIVSALLLWSFRRFQIVFWEAFSCGGFLFGGIVSPVLDTVRWPCRWCCSRDHLHDRCRRALPVYPLLSRSWRVHRDWVSGRCLLWLWGEVKAPNLHRGGNFRRTCPPWRWFPWRLHWRGCKVLLHHMSTIAISWTCCYVLRRFPTVMIPERILPRSWFESFRRRACGMFHTCNHLFQCWWINFSHRHPWGWFSPQCRMFSEWCSGWQLRCWQGRIWWWRHPANDFCSLCSRFLSV